MIFGISKTVKTNKMKKFILLALLLVAKGVNGQPPQYNDLSILFADENYEKLVKESENYTLKESTSKDALPHLWMARGLYKVSLSGTAGVRFKNAYKDAFGEIGKMYKYDKDSTVRVEYAEFLDEFKASAVDLISNDFLVKDYKKASSWILKYYKLDPKSIGGKFADGACKFRNSDKGGANTLWKEGEKMLSGLSSIDNLQKADKDLLRIGVLETAQCFVDSKQADKAKALLGKVAQWFENDEAFKTRYDQIVNGK